MAAGRWRGGIGTVREFQMLVDGGFSVEGDGHRFRPWGFDGGVDGHVARLQLIDTDEKATDLVSKVPYHKLRKGERLRSLGPCGGGYGDPLARAPEDILDDVLDLQYKMLVKRMFLTMRNTNISSLVSLQYPNLVPKAIRTSVYFTLLFYLNTDEAVELAVRGWLSAYLPGHTVKEKMLFYRRWTKQGHGHQMILVDNLNHKCYLVDSEYYCKELPMITTLEYDKPGEAAKKRRKGLFNDSEKEESMDSSDDGY